MAKRFTVLKQRLKEGWQMGDTDWVERTSGTFVSVQRTKLKSVGPFCVGKGLASLLLLI